MSCLLAADLATNTATAVDDLTATLGLHASTESDRAASFDVADSSWVVNGHVCISKKPDRLDGSGSDCRPCHSKGLARDDQALDNLSQPLEFGLEIVHTT